MPEKRKRSINRWWSNEWMNILESFGWTAELARGKIHVRTGKIHEFIVIPGMVQANVQEKEHEYNSVVIQVDTLPSYQWDKILDVLANNAIFTIKLLAGEMPYDIKDAFDQTGIFMFPESPNSLSISCSCSDQGILCRHAAAVFYAFTMKLEEDPLLLFELRGMDRKALNEALRDRRSERATHYQEDDQEVSDDLQLEAEWDSSTMENFWVGGMGKTNLNITITPPSTEEFVFNKLGEPAFFSGKRDMVRQLKRDYRRILSKALTAGYFEDKE